MRNTPGSQPPAIVREFRKNANEIVRASLGEFAGRQTADIRVWMPRHSDGQLVPSRKGLTIDRALLPQLEEAVIALRLATATESHNAR